MPPENDPVWGHPGGSLREHEKIHGPNLHGPGRVEHGSHRATGRPIFTAGPAVFSQKGGRGPRFWRNGGSSVKRLAEARNRAPQSPAPCAQRSPT